MHRTEFFRVHRLRRTYDRQHGKFTFSISYSTAAKLTPRSLAVSEAFGLGADEERTFPVLDVELKIGSSDIVYVTGDSGSGKSVLLRAIKQDLGDEAVDVAELEVDRTKPLIETVGKTVEEGLELLSRVGLNDAFLFLRSYEQLSDGQRYRYRIAKLLETKAKFWLLDEFAATLDRDTAKIVSFNLQKIARYEGKCVIAATTHTDLFQDLNPSVHIHKRFGKEIAVHYYPNEPAKECSLVPEMRVEEGSAADWKNLADFHYRSHRTPAPRRIFCLKRGEELCGVIVYSYAAPAAFGRRLVLPSMNMKELNEKLSAISRVVIHPKYRTIGLGVKLVRETLPLAGTPYIEMSAVMAKYNPFAEKAGMKKVALQPPSLEVRKVAGVLEELGFDCQLLSSGKYVAAKLAALSNSDLARLKQAFMQHKHPRFLKVFSFNMPYGTGDAYRKAVQQADPSQLAHLVKICGFLMQTKAYLFWKNPDYVYKQNCNIQKIEKQLLQSP